MRKLTAPLILAPDGKFRKKYTLIVDNDTIVDLVEGEKSDAEYFDGILCPAFVNAHGHLELSHMKDHISNGNGLDGFIKEFIATRTKLGVADEDILTAADEHMWDCGIIAAGDISNHEQSFHVKQKSKIRYHTFIELFTMDSNKSSAVFEQGVSLFKDTVRSQLSSSLVPHAPYSVPPELFELIRSHHQYQKSYWCIHNQESFYENELFVNGTGPLAGMFAEMKINRDWFKPTGQSPVVSLVNYYPDLSNLLFVHNTFMTRADLEFLQSEKLFDRTWFCICPNANLYIENRLPDINMFVKHGCNLVIGTDSLASNNRLSVFDELVTIHRAFPDIPVEMLLTWSTRNGARYFDWYDLGIFERGAKPGVLNLPGCSENKLNDSCRVTRII